MLRKNNSRVICSGIWGYILVRYHFRVLCFSLFTLAEYVTLLGIVVFAGPDDSRLTSARS